MVESVIIITNQLGWEEGLDNVLFISFDSVTLINEILMIISMYISIIIRDLNSIIIIIGIFVWQMISIVLYHFIVKNEKGGSLAMFIMITIMMVFIEVIVLVFLIFVILFIKIIISVPINEEE